MIRNPLTRALCLLLSGYLILGPLGCRNPMQSALPPSAIAPPGTKVPPLPKGDLYADETVVSADAIVDPGDTLDIIIRRGAGEEKHSNVVQESGMVVVSFLEVDVKGQTAAQAAESIKEAVTPYMNNPHVQVLLKKKSLKLKRFFVFGDVKKPGHFPLARNMTVLQAVVSAETYNETALLDEIRVIRGGDLNNPQILVADISRAMTYGDMSRNLALQENDIVYVPRERLGDARETATKIFPLIYIGITPIFFAALVPTFFPGAKVGGN
ncbi:MAG TPA: polysaccharide biosynthesis/export family protein [Nitrospiraceae bacterium]